MGQQKIFLSPLLLLMIFQAILAAEIKLEGRVRDVNTHREIAGVNVFIPEANVGATSSSSGRFELTISNSRPEMIVIFEHVAYDTLRLTLEKALAQKNIYLQERIIPLPAIEVTEKGEKLDIEKDLPQTISVLNARSFELKGYVDAGDLLRTDHSIQVNEELSGQKTVSIRGGNPDEVIVLYNGVKMNSALDNVFDISLIDLEDVQRFEVIKGSNTSLYGPEAFSGIINIVPRLQQDYTVRFQQRIGSYDSGNWGLHLYKDFKRLYGSYSINKGGARRKFAGEPEGRQLLENLSEHHTASIGYNFGEAPAGFAASSLGLMYIRTKLDYTNERDNEFLENFNQMVSARFDGNIGPLKNLTLTSAYQWLEEEQFLNVIDSANTAPGSNFLDRDINSQTFHLNFEKALRLNAVGLLFAYQYKNSLLNFKDQRIFAGEIPLGLESADMRRLNHGFVAIGKLFAPAGSDFFSTMDFNLSVRYDHVKDTQNNPVFRNENSNVQIGDSIGYFMENVWDEATVKFSTFLSGGRNDFALNAYMNFGTNVKFPTLLQQISTPNVFAPAETRPNLDPEKNTGIEIGAVLLRETRQNLGIYGWQFSANFFRNSYQNKVRVYYSPGLPVAVYDNVKTAQISGLEAKPAVFFLRKKVIVEAGFARYFFSEKATFPFKYDWKQTLNFVIDHAGYSLQLFAFRESEQVALIRNYGGGFSSVELPGFTNMDIHLSKTFEIRKLKFIFNLSLRNILYDEFELEGLALRDRRYYITFGAQY